MIRYYRGRIEKHPVGTAVEHREPPLEGEVVVSVRDSTTGGDYKLFVVDSDDAQHESNLTLPGVEPLEEDAAVELAARYQPATTGERFDPQTGAVEAFDVLAVDLAALLARRE